MTRCVRNKECHARTCWEKFYSEDDLEIHMARTHHFECWHCRKRFPLAILWREHEERKHGQSFEAAAIEKLQNEAQKRHYKFEPFQRFVDSSAPASALPLPNTTPIAFSDTNQMMTEFAARHPLPLSPKSPRQVRFSRFHCPDYYREQHVFDDDFVHINLDEKSDSDNPNDTRQLELDQFNERQRQDFLKRRAQLHIQQLQTRALLRSSAFGRKQPVQQSSVSPSRSRSPRLKSQLRSPLPSSTSLYFNSPSGRIDSHISRDAFCDSEVIAENEANILRPSSIEFPVSPLAPLQCRS